MIYVLKMDTIQFLLTLLQFTVASMACNITTVQKCFVNLSKDLNIDSDKMEGSELINIINPSTLHGDQVKLCLSLDMYDFGPLRRCIRHSDCEDQSLLQEAEPGVLPSLTWMTITDMIEGICEPGCENLQSKNAEAEKCGMKTGTCMDLEESFSCYRNIIGRCKVLVTFTKSIFDNLGVFEMGKQHCPDIDYSLELSAANYANPALLCQMVCYLFILLVWR